MGKRERLKKTNFQLFFLTSFALHSKINSEESDAILEELFCVIDRNEAPSEALLEKVLTHLMVRLMSE